MITATRHLVTIRTYRAWRSVLFLICVMLLGFHAPVWAQAGSETISPRLSVPFAGTYTGTTFAAGGRADRTLVLRQDGTAIFATNYQGGRQFVQSGAWDMRQRAGQNYVLVVTLTVQNGQPTFPEELVFQPQRNNTLSGIQYDRRQYGANFQLTRSSGPAPPPVTGFAGAYIGTAQTTAGFGQRTMRVFANGSVYWRTAYPGDGFVEQQGTWTTGISLGEPVLIVTFTTQNNRPINQRLVFAQRGNQLVAIEFDPYLYGRGGVTLRRVEGPVPPPIPPPVPTPATYIGTYYRTSIGPGGPVEMTLRIQREGDATLIWRQLRQGYPRTIRLAGSWVTERRGAQEYLLVTFTQRDGSPIPPDRLVFIRTGNTLTAVEFNQQNYGDSLVFQRIAR